MKFVVVVQQGADNFCVGPYGKFKRAEGDARAWDGTAGADGVARIACVLPMKFPSEYAKEEARLRERKSA